MGMFAKKKEGRHLKLASPCTASWAAMGGDERVRFCGMCSKNVYNLSAMTEGEVDKLFNSTDGRLCVRFLQRADGTIITDDCPVGLRAVRARSRQVYAACALAVSMAAAYLCGGAWLSRRDAASSEARSQALSAQSVAVLAHRKQLEERARRGPVGQNAPVLEGVGGMVSVRVNNLERGYGFWDGVVYFVTNACVDAVNWVRKATERVPENGVSTNHYAESTLSSGGGGDAFATDQ